MDSRLAKADAAVTELQQREISSIFERRVQFVHREIEIAKEQLQTAEEQLKNHQLLTRQVGSDGLG